METSVFLNDGSGHFSMKPLPVEAQFSPVYAAETGDFNNDGKADILLGGNLFNVKPEVGRYDASYGSFLAGDGKGGFRNIPVRESGFRLEGEIRDIMELPTSAGSIVVVARSNDPLQIFKVLF
jgi:hypothetical protein